MEEFHPTEENFCRIFFVTYEKILSSPALECSMVSVTLNNKLKCEVVGVFRSLLKLMYST